MLTLKNRAFADMLVGLLIMPLTLTYEIVGKWILGKSPVLYINLKTKKLQLIDTSGSLLCELWLALDVLFVTASILHICIISLDRYWLQNFTFNTVLYINCYRSVTYPLTYPSKRTPTRICIMVGG